MSHLSLLPKWGYFVGVTVKKPDDLVNEVFTSSPFPREYTPAQLDPNALPSEFTAFFDITSDHDLEKLRDVLQSSLVKLDSRFDAPEPNGPQLYVYTGGEDIGSKPNAVNLDWGKPYTPHVVRKGSELSVKIDRIAVNRLAQMINAKIEKYVGGAPEPMSFFLPPPYAGHPIAEVSYQSQYISTKMPQPILERTPETFDSNDHSCIQKVFFDLTNPTHAQIFLQVVEKAVHSPSSTTLSAIFKRSYTSDARDPYTRSFSLDRKTLLSEREKHLNTARNWVGQVERSQNKVISIETNPPVPTGFSDNGGAIVLSFLTGQRVVGIKPHDSHSPPAPPPSPRHGD